MAASGNSQLKRQSAHQRCRCKIKRRQQTVTSIYSAGKPAPGDGSALLVFWVVQTHWILFGILRRDPDNQIKTDGQFTSL